MQYIPPPTAALPFLIVNPSSTLVAVSPLANFTVVPKVSPSMIVVAAPSLLFSVIALPLKRMRSA